jgi:nitroreductase
LFVAALKRREPAAAEAQIEKERGKPLRAPITIAVAGKIIAGHKIPEIEQALSVGAAAMNMLNAVHALGFGAKWVTGANCYDAEFKKDFGLDRTDQLVGFIHIGTPKESPAAMERPAPGEFVVEWTRPGSGMLINRQGESI